MVPSGRALEEHEGHLRREGAVRQHAAQDEALEVDKVAQEGGGDHLVHHVGEGLQELGGGWQGGQQGRQEASCSEQHPGVAAKGAGGEGSSSGRQGGDGPLQSYELALSFLTRHRE